MRIRLAIPDRLVTPQALEAALEATSLANAEAIRRGEVPHIEDARLGRKIRWAPEPFLDGEHFDLADQVLQRGWGDCDDLAPWLTGSLLASGDDPGARSRVYKTGKNRWHVVTETSDGKILDPSRWAGMGKRAVPPGVSGTLARPFARPHTGAIAVMPHRGSWWARCDIPFPEGYHLASVARSRDVDNALVRSINGAIDCGTAIESPLVDRMCCAGDFLVGEVGASYVEKLIHKNKQIRKDWEAQAAAKGYSAENPPPESGPDSWHDYGIAHGLHEGGTGFGAALKWAAGKTQSVANTAAPFANFAMPGSGTMLSALSRGAGMVLPPPEGGPVMRSPTGAVSIPLEGPDTKTAQHMFLYYHPQGSPGPVVMRF